MKDDIEWMYCEMCEKETLHYTTEVEKEVIMTECQECHVIDYK